MADRSMHSQMVFHYDLNTLTAIWTPSIGPKNSMNLAHKLVSTIDYVVIQSPKSRTIIQCNKCFPKSCIKYFLYAAPVSQMRKRPRSLNGLANTSAMFSYDNGLLAGYSSPGPWRIGWCVAHGGGAGGH